MTGTHALVIGGGLAGLLAARVLAGHFARVTIVERDRLPSAATFRPGVPQSRHVHGLLARGRLILEELFPGLDDELAAAGAPSIDWTADCGLFSFGRWRPRVSSGIVTRSGSRELLEWSLHRRVAALGGINIADEREVTGLMAGPDGTRIVGVHVRPRGAVQSGHPIEALPADLVVDASGRGSRGASWLADLDFAPPPETVVDAALGYASRCYARPDGFLADWKALLVQATPPGGTRGAVLIPIEGERWLVTLAGAAQDYPPTDEAGFLAFARSLPTPLLADAIAGARPLGAIFGYRKTENRLRRCEAVRRWPAGFLMLGDAACAFNPVYGQGMTVCAEEALVLDHCLRDRRPARPDPGAGLAQRFQRKLARIHEPAWLLATGEDFRYPTTAGGRPGPSMRLLQRYIDRVIRATAEDPIVLRAFLEVWHMLKPPSALLRPGLAFRVMAAAAHRVT